MPPAAAAIDGSAASRARLTNASPNERVELPTPRPHIPIDQNGLRPRDHPRCKGPCGRFLRMEVAMKNRSRLITAMVAAFAALAPVKSASSQTATGPPCADRARIVDVLHAHW